MGHAKDLYLTHVALYMTVEIGPLVKIDYHSYICESICRTKGCFLGILVEKPKTNEMVPKGSYKE